MGMTLRQADKARFYMLLEEYKNALRTGEGIVLASVLIHAAKGRVPKRLWPLVNKVYREIHTPANSVLT